MLVFDANILVRAVLGSKVLLLLRRYAEQVEFLAPDVAFEEARQHLPEILAGRQIPICPSRKFHRHVFRDPPDRNSPVLAELSGSCAPLPSIEPSFSHAGPVNREWRRSSQPAWLQPV
jgi:hypothetical protein